MTATSGGQRCTQRKESQWRRPYFCCLSCYTKVGVVYASALEELGMVGRNLSAGRPELLGRSASIAGKNVARGVLQKGHLFPRSRKTIVAWSLSGHQASASVATIASFVVRPSFRSFSSASTASTALLLQGRNSSSRNAPSITVATTTTSRAVLL